MENPERVTYFAATDARGKFVPFGIKAKDRDRHMYVIGKTGMGKSTLLENMAIQDIRNGEGLAFIDPHGGTVERLLDYIPQDRIKDVVYFAPFDMENPIAFNVMEDVGYDKRHLVVSGLMATFKKIWEDAWSARMEYILTNTLLALLEYPGATLLGVNRMYTDKEYRNKVIENVKDPVVKDFWVKEFANYGDRYTQEATPAIQNKVGQFTGNPLIRNIIGQSKSSFDIRTMMDQKKILIINLSKGLVGETNMRLLGSMLTTRLFLAAMSRADLPAHELAKKPHFYFYVDEFQNFANETFAEILSEARKYKLNLIIAHQYIEQMEEEVRDAVFGNVGTTVVFRVGPFDAEVLETVFAPRFTQEDIVGLDRRQVYLTLMIDGVGSAPFSAVTIPPIEPPPSSFREEVIKESRKTYAVPRATIESAIIQELAQSAAAEAPRDARMKRPGPAFKNGVPKNSVAPLRERPAERSAISQNSVPHTTLVSPVSPATSTDAIRGHQSTGLPMNQKQIEHAQVSHENSHSGPKTNIVDIPPTAPTPLQKNKSADDLRAILRTMATKNSVETEKKRFDQQQSLKGALAEVLAKESSVARSDTHVASSENSVRQSSSTEEAVPVAEPKNSSPDAKIAKSAGADRPFEVPEDALRRVLKGET